MSIHSIPENHDLISHSNNPTTYPDIVYTIEPVILHVTYFLRMLRWKSGYTGQSTTALLVWTFVWFHPCIIVYLIPLFIAIFFYHEFATEPPILTKTSTLVLHDRLTAELKDIQYEILMFIPSAESKDQLKGYWRSLFVLTTHQKLLRFASMYTVWVICLKLLRYDTIIWIFGLLVLSWNSSLFRVIRYSYHRAAFVFGYANRTNVPQQAMTLSNHPNSDTSYHEHYNRCYHFRVIEHQRWWLHRGWTALLLPNERPEWSDEYLAQVPSIHKFHLPPPITKFNPKTQKMTTITWQWESQEWQIDDNRNVDKDGFEYGSFDWKKWCSKSSGLRVLTRRRFWTRNARLIVQESEQTSRPAPINIKRSSSHSTATTVSLSTSYSSEDSTSSYLCATPTTSLLTPTTTGFLPKYQTKSSPTSTISLNYHQTVEHTNPFTNTASNVEAHFWLRR
ncbi:integral peroxisomal membrane peroxin-domain-containing protein [Parasitella parasitica]|nr:integral peroxisomal membrane peroxin-domain-containing protein [Parasitella parasitica]